jgi:ABC-2 type transport system permease protein
MRALISLSKAMVLGFVRDRTALFFTILFPLMFLLIFGGVFSKSDTPRPKVFQIGTVPIIETMPAEARAELDNALNLQPTSDRDSALEKVRKGDYAGAVEQAGQSVVVHYSAADQVKSSTVHGILTWAVQQANVAASGTAPVYSVDAQQVEDTSLKPIQYVTPGLLSWAVATGAGFGAAMTLVSWRQKKMLRRLRLSPVGTSTIIGARVVVSLVVALAQTAIFLVVAVPFLGLKLSSAWWMSIPVVFCGALAFLSIGMLAGARAKTPEGASAIVNLVVLPMAFLSGAFFPVDAGPAWMQAASRLLPMRYVVDALQDVMVRGQGPASALPAMGILLAFAGVVTLVASRLFRWEDA